MLEIRQLTKRFSVTSTSAPIFENLDFVLNTGEYCALMGESGAGKSTLLNIIAGLEPPSSGAVTLEGRALDANADDAVTLFRDRKSVV